MFKLEVTIVVPAGSRSVTKEFDDLILAQDVCDEWINRIVTGCRVQPFSVLATLSDGNQEVVV